MMERLVCIHAHFYQPPRENPWLESVELQDSAAPYHDWNERIAAECYAPTAFARLLGAGGRIERIVSNYSRISFNVGPTLLAWMKEKAPDVHNAIIEADRLSRERFSGHGSALAQCYNHMIMPLANPRDRRTQVLWGIRDFEHRFGRKPEGMWLPETAANDESLDALAEQGIRFTILSPFQAREVRPIGSHHWHDANHGRVDPHRPYLVRLPSGRKITVFFYDAYISKAVAFERLLDDGHRFAHRVLDSFDDDSQEPQLAHIATDGESYGHHHRHGEMALAFALNSIDSSPHARLTNYAEFLEQHPPKWEARIHQKSAWSCAHGVERWNSHCGCNSGGRPNWNQHWRAPLRHALDWLRDELAPRFASKASEYLKDPWKARDEYIEIILDRSSENLDAFFQRHGTREFDENERVTAIRLLEMQRHAMLMYTSCGWFFDEISGIETVQIIQYAARAIQLAQDLLGEDLEPEFLRKLENAKSNIREHRDGRRIYEKFVRPAIINREKVGAHYAVSSLFETYGEQARIYAFTVEQEDRRYFTAGHARLAAGRIKVRFEITKNFDTITYAVLHWGDHHLNCGVRYFQGLEAYEAMCREIKDAFDRADFSQIVRLMDQHFGESNYSLKSLFRDEQRRIVNQILTSTRDDVHNSFRFITDRYMPLLRFLGDISVPAPRSLEMAVHFVLSSDIRQQFESDKIDMERVRGLLEEAERDKVPLDAAALAYAMKGHLDRLSAGFEQTPMDLEQLRYFSQAAQLARDLPFEVNLWKIQNAYFRTLGSIYPDVLARAQAGSEAGREWVHIFRDLGDSLGFEPCELPPG
jgi:alpha-amylase/alpha-mannosidase (GH57 family)